MTMTISASATAASPDAAGCAAILSSRSTRRAKASRCSAVGAEHAHVLDRAHRANRGDLCKRLAARAEDAERAGFRLGQEFGRKPACRAGAHPAEIVGLDHCFQLGIVRRIQQHVKTCAVAAGIIGFQSKQRFGAPGCAHQIERAAAHAGALPRQVDGLRVRPGREQLFKRGNRILDGDQPADVFFGEIDRTFSFGRSLHFDRGGALRASL